jgi:tetratricopeptide (TPR) repeat protein
MGAVSRRLTEFASFLRRFRRRPAFRAKAKLPQTPIFQYAFNMNKRSTLPLLVALATLSAAPAYADCKLEKLPDIPVTMRGPRAMVPATVNGSPGLFMVDTGAFYSSISPAGVAKYGLKVGPSAFGMTVTGAGRGDAQFSIGTAKMFTFDSLPFNDTDFIILGNGRGGDGDGSIGQNILGAPDVEYDLANGAIRLFKATGCQDADLAYWNTTQDDSAVSIQSDGFLSPPLAYATINGVRIRVVFDTGSPRSMLSLVAAARAGIKPTDPGVVSAGYNAGVASRSQFRTWRGNFDSFKLGNEEIKNTPLLFGDIDLVHGDMLLGADFFLSHRVFVANSQHKIYFTYNGGPVFNLDTARPADASAPAAVAETPAAGNTDSPLDADGYARRAAAFVSRRDFPSAIADLTHAMTLAPDNADYVYQRGRAELANRQPFLAMADLNQSLKLKPDNILALLARAEVYWAAHQPAKARDDLAAADGFADKDPDRRLAIGVVYGALRLFKEGLPDLDQWIAAHPVDSRRPTALNQRCWYRAQLGEELDKAMADCNEALHLDPGEPNMLDSRGLVYVRLGDFDKAIIDYDAALKVNPNEAWSLYGRGLAELRKGRTAPGQADIKAAEAINPRLADEAKTAGLEPAPTP